MQISDFFAPSPSLRKTADDRLSLRKAGRSMEFHPQSRFRGDRRDIRRTVEEKSTLAPDRKKLQTTVERPGLLSRRLRPRPIRNPCARSLQSRVATPLGPFCAKLAAAWASGAGAIFWITDRNPGKFGRRRKRSNSSRRGRSEEIFRRIRESFLDFPVKAFLKCCHARVVSAALPRRMGTTRLVQLARRMRRSHFASFIIRSIATWLGFCR
jgi:hypothetical protein